MAGPLAPVLTQIVPTTGDPVALDTIVATIAQPPGETDPGPFTYDITQDPGAAYAVSGSDLLAAIDGLDGAFYVALTATSALGTSSEGSATLVFADDLDPWTDTDDPYAGNPQIPPPTPDTERWQSFLRSAVHGIVPRARDGVDYVVAREEGKTSGQAILGWDDALLGPCPTTEIEAYAKQLADAWPWSEPPPA